MILEVVLQEGSPNLLHREPHHNQEKLQGERHNEQDS